MPHRPSRSRPAPRPDSVRAARPRRPRGAPSVERAVLAAALDPIVTIDFSGTILSASDSVKRVFGWTPRELVGRNITVLMPDPHRSAHRAYLAEHRRTGKTRILNRARELEARRKDGTVIPVEICVSRVELPPPRGPVFVGIIRDLTERARALLAARESESRLRLALDAGALGICAHDVASGMVELDARARAIFGIRAAKVPLARLGEILHPADADRVTAFIDRVTDPRAQLEPASIEYRLRRSDGRAVWVSARVQRSAPDRRVPGDDFRVIAVVEDVTARRVADEHLRRRDEHLRVALRGAHAGVWEWDFRSQKLVWSPEEFALFGFDEAEGAPSYEEFLRRVHPDDLARVKRADRLALDRPGTEQQIEFRINHPALGVRWILSVGRVTLDRDGSPERMSGIDIDVTARKEAETQLRQHREQLERLVEERTRALRESHDKLRMADRMASIGTLAAGLGHDMNNVLLPVRAHLNALLAMPQLPEPGRAPIEAVRRSVAYLQQLADGLHYLAMDPDNTLSDAVSTDLAAWWGQAGAVITKAVPKHVRVQSAIGKDLPEVGVAPHRLTQAVLNLVVNAGEAIPADRKRRQGLVRVWAERAPDPGWVRLGVTDNGRGMSDEVKRRAFELFFTTKTRGLGTGLGLPLVQRVVSRAGGRVSIDSKLGQGTTVAMEFPASASAPHGAAGAPTVWLRIADGRSAALARQLCEAGGARVFETRPRARVDALITDAGLPDLRAARAVRRAHPGVRVLVLGEPPRRSLAEAWRELGADILVETTDFGAIRERVGRLIAGV